MTKIQGSFAEISGSFDTVIYNTGSTCGDARRIYRGQVYADIRDLLRRDRALLTHVFISQVAPVVTRGGYTGGRCVCGRETAREWGMSMQKRPIFPEKSSKKSPTFPINPRTRC